METFLKMQLEKYYECKENISILATLVAFVLHVVMSPMYPFGNGACNVCSQFKL